MMNEILSIDEMKSRYPNEWILIGDPQTNDASAVVGGQVLWHSTDRDEVYMKSVELRPKHIAYHYTGKVPQDNMEFAL